MHPSQLLERWRWPNVSGKRVDVRLMRTQHFSASVCWLWDMPQGPVTARRTNPYQLASTQRVTARIEVIAKSAGVEFAGSDGYLQEEGGSRAARNLQIDLLRYVRQQVHMSRPIPGRRVE